MAMTDPIADMLTRIRNANLRRHEVVEMPLSKMRLGIAKILKEEGFIQGYKVIREGDFQRLRLHLRYVGQDLPVITGLRRISRPGLRAYVGKDKIPSVRRGLGVAILSTSKGLMTDKESRRKQIGGEVLCHVW
jgi:small subunit ribosomal protein S8